MAGKIKEMIDSIIQERSKGNSAIAETTKAKLILKGLNPNKFDRKSEDDPIIIQKLLTIAKQFNIRSLDESSANIKSVYSSKVSEKEAVLDLKNQLMDHETKLLIFFASPHYDPDKLSYLVQEAFEGSLVLGCTTAGELVNGKILKNSIVAMSVNSNIISDAKIEVIENMKESLNIEDAFYSFEEHFNESSYSMDLRKYIGLVLIDGLSYQEEKLMDLIGNRTDIFFIGGSAGDNLEFKSTYVYANGTAYTDSAVLIMMKMDQNAEFGLIKTNSFNVLDDIFVANKVNVETREVIEFNNRPALCVYAQAVGAASLEDVPHYFSTHPVGLFAGDDIYIRSPRQVKGTNIVFYCNILEGMEVRLLETANVIEDTQKAIEEKINEWGRIDGIIDFDCIERIQQIEKKGLDKEYAGIFKTIPTIGFSTYGEAFIGQNNQTATMLVFKTNI